MTDSERASESATPWLRAHVALDPSVIDPSASRSNVTLELSVDAKGHGQLRRRSGDPGRSPEPLLQFELQPEMLVWLRTVAGSAGGSSGRWPSGVGSDLETPLSALEPDELDELDDDQDSRRRSGVTGSPRRRRRRGGGLGTLLFVALLVFVGWLGWYGLQGRPIPGYEAAVEGLAGLMTRVVPPHPAKPPRVGTVQR